MIQLEINQSKTNSQTGSLNYFCIRKYKSKANSPTHNLTYFKVIIQWDNDYFCNTRVNHFWSHKPFSHQRTPPLQKVIDGDFNLLPNHALEEQQYNWNVVHIHAVTNLWSSRFFERKVVCHAVREGQSCNQMFWIRSS